VRKCFADLSSLTTAFVLSFQSSITHFDVEYFKKYTSKTTQLNDSADIAITRKKTYFGTINCDRNL